METLYNLAPPLPLWNSLRVERLCPRPKSCFVHQIKHNSQLSGLDFSVNTTLGTLLLLNVLNIVNFYKYLRVFEKKMETVADFLGCGAPKSLQMVTVAMKLKDSCSLGGKL